MSGNVADLPDWAKDRLKDHEDRIRVLEKTRFILFGIGTGVGTIATLLGSGSIKSLLKLLG